MFYLGFFVFVSLFLYFTYNRCANEIKEEVSYGSQNDSGSYEDIDDCAPLNDSDYSDIFENKNESLKISNACSIDENQNKVDELNLSYKSIDYEKFDASNVDWVTYFSISSIHDVYDLLKFLLDFDHIKETQEKVNEDLISLLRSKEFSEKYRNFNDFSKECTRIMNERFSYVENIRVFYLTLINGNRWLKRLFDDLYLKAIKMFNEPSASLSFDEIFNGLSSSNIHNDNTNTFLLTLSIYCHFYNEYVKEICELEQIWLKLVFDNRKTEITQTGMFVNNFEHFGITDIYNCFTHLQVYDKCEKRFLTVQNKDEAIPKKPNKIEDMNEKDSVSDDIVNLRKKITELYTYPFSFFICNEWKLKEWCENPLKSTKIKNRLVSAFIKNFNGCDMLNIYKSELLEKVNNNAIDLEEEGLTEFREFYRKFNADINEFKQNIEKILANINRMKIIEATSTIYIDSYYMKSIISLEKELYLIYYDLLYTSKNSYLYSHSLCYQKVSDFLLKNKFY